MMISSYKKWALTPFMLLTPFIALVLAGCASNPTGGTNFVLVSEKGELEEGKTEHEKLMKTAPVYHDDKLQAFVEKVGKRLVAVSDRPALDYHFTIMDSPDINAFALPGYVYVNRGLLDLLTSESQLAAVMGHEIGHIAARHSARQETAAKTSNILSTTAAIASVITTGTTALGDTANLFGGALVSGYGRDMELEADGLGAKYLQKAGYNPKAMIEVLTVLKNNEDFNRRVSKKAAAYHGLFATHPRSDTRLQEAVAKSGNVKADQSQIQENPEDFRTATTGLVVGFSMQNLQGSQTRNLFYQTLLNYVIVLPDGWKTTETTTTMTANAPAGSQGSLKIEALRLQQYMEPRLFVRDELKIPDLQQAETLNQFGLDGYTGIHPTTKERIALIYYNRRAFVITGSGAADKSLLDAIKTFRPIARNEGAYANQIRINWVQADGRATYADLAKQSPLPDYPEETLRLMNGDYPSGQPAAGRWIKIAK